MEEKTIQEIVREMEVYDLNGRTTSSKYVSFSMREDINTTEAYLNSQFTSGKTDSLGREKPFANIVIPQRNIWFRATDLDVKNIVVRATDPSKEIEAFLATLKLQEWLKKANFGKVLNDWGLSLASHGSSVVKFIDKGGELCASVIDWNTLLCDAVDFENNPVVEKLWLTPAQLRKNKNYDQKYVKQLLDNQEVRKTIEGTTVDTKAGFIPVYEVHGEFSLATYKQAKGEKVEEGDEEEFFQQMHVVTFVRSKENHGQFDEYTLYVGRETKSPYKLTHLIKKDGQTYAGGAVKNLFDAQWMVNLNEKLVKEQLELGSKQIYQTSDEQFIGQNALTNIENGEILIHDEGKPLTRVENTPDTVAMRNSKVDWQNIAAQINGISEAMLGQNPPSGTAWRQTQALLQESHSLFEIMTENKGLYLVEMLTEFIIPFIKKQLNNSEAISLILEEHQIKQIDMMFLPNEVTRKLNEKKKKTILSGAIYDPDVEAADRAQAEAELKGLLKGNQRFIKPSDISSKTWKEVFKDLEWDLDYHVTGENKDIQGAMATLTTALQTVAGNPGVLQDPNARLLFNKILNLAGSISPIEISLAQEQTPPAMPMPTTMQPQMAQPA